MSRTLESLISDVLVEIRHDPFSFRNQDGAYEYRRQFEHGILFFPDSVPQGVVVQYSPIYGDFTFIVSKRLIEIDIEVD